MADGGTIAITSSGPSLDAPMDERFGRCPCFIIVDSGATVVDSVENPCATQGHGAGIQAAKLVADTGVGVVLTGRCGPNASDTLEAAGVAVVTGCSGTVREALDAYNAARGTA
jgi:predicted Fe-Mo cluster-binding NifX family protein